MNSAAVAGVIGAALFMIVAVGGIIAAIAIPNLLNAIQRGKQKRTMVDMRSIATAVESYAVDHNAYPPATSFQGLSRYLEPTYVAKVPEMDGWMHPFRYVAWSRRDSSRPEEYIILSAGKDGLFEHEDAGEYREGTTTNFNNDIVFSNGSFVQYPAQ